MMNIAITVKHYRFACKPWILVLVTALLALLLSLGRWQLHRAQYKRELQQDFALRQQAHPLTLAQVKSAANLRFYPMQVSGRFDNRHTVLLDNQFYRHQLGYHVLTPFKPIGEQRLLWINRGWIAAPKQRTILPAIPAILGRVTLTGLIKVPDSKGVTLGRADDMMRQPSASLLRIESVKLARLDQYTGKPALPFILLLTADQPGSFICDWQPVDMKPYIHTGYALQWFAFAATLLIVFIITHTRNVEEIKD